MVFRTGSKREAPWPFDLRMGFLSTAMTGYMLGVQDQDSQAKVQTQLIPGLVATPTEYKYGAQQPNVESTFAQTNLTGGYGQRYFRDHADDLTRYYWAIGVDCACEGAAQLGPLITVVTPDAVLDTTNGISHFYEGTISSTKNLFALNGRYALWRNGGDAASNWDQSNDFTVGKVAKDVVVWAQNTGTGGTTYAFVAMGDGTHIWRHDFASGTTTWTQHATLDALCFAKGQGNALFKGVLTNLVQKCLGTADPWTATNWVDVARIGDATSPIVRMVVHPDGTLYVFKTDGWYVILEDGSVIPLSTSLYFQPNADNGRYQSVFENDIVATYAGSTFAIGPGGSVRPVGPERMTENNTEVRGRVTASVATPWGLVAGLWNDDDSVSHVMKWGSWRTGDDGISHRQDAWHGSISRQYTSKITALSRTTVGAATNHERIMIGFANGQIGYYLLNCVPNPRACSSYRYTTTELNGLGCQGVLYTSNFDALFSIDNKHLHWSAITIADALSGGAFVSSEHYKNDGLDPAGGLEGGTAGTAAWAGTTTGVSGVTTPPGGRTDATNGQVFVSLASQLRFSNGGSSTVSPTVTGWGMGYAIRPTVTLAHELLIFCEDGLLANDEHPLKIGASQIRANVFDFTTSAGDFFVELMGSTGLQRVAISEFEEKMAWDPRGEGVWRQAIRLLVLQTQARTENYGGASGLGS